jgi:hypothetical protein
MECIAPGVMSMIAVDRQSSGVLGVRALMMPAPVERMASEAYRVFATASYRILADELVDTGVSGNWLRCHQQFSANYSPAKTGCSRSATRVSRPESTSRNW